MKSLKIISGFSLTKLYVTNIITWAEGDCIESYIQLKLKLSGDEVEVQVISDASVLHALA